MESWPWYQWSVLLRCGTRIGESGARAHGQCLPNQLRDDVCALGLRPSFPVTAGVSGFSPQHSTQHSQSAEVDARCRRVTQKTDTHVTINTATRTPMSMGTGSRSAEERRMGMVARGAMHSSPTAV